MREVLAGPPKVAAYQLSLFGDTPKPGKYARPVFWGLFFCGLMLPPSEEAMRQMRMLNGTQRTA